MSTTPTQDYDLIVVGFGAAGVSAAIEAADAGARVLALDRGFGGGATALSGGIVYAGGGTPYQQAAGVDDDPDNMFRYLQQEVRGAVSDETLRRFCEQSPEMIAWLERQGASFQASLAAFKTSYPTDRHYLYYSGNEKAHPYRDKARPAARGHRQIAKGLGSGKVLYARLKASALRKGVTFLPHSMVDELIIEEGVVTGVRYRTADSATLGPNYERLSLVAGKLGNWAPAVGARLSAKLTAEWRRAARSVEARARGVLLAGGGFVHNEEWMDRWAGPYRDISPLGTVGDDGSSISLGLSAGGVTDHMDRMTAWRFINPPSAMTEGVSVDGRGQRIVNEDLYGATFADHMVRSHDARGYLILDAKQWRKARRQILSQTNTFQLAQQLYLYTIGHKKAHDLAALAHKLDVPAAELEATVTAYNAGILSGKGDPAGKARELSSTILSGPYFAVDLSVKNSPFHPAPGLTLGGLKVDEETGHVLNESDERIAGLFAAGRSAVGVCAIGYISGLSIADCLFSGRRAGRTVATTPDSAEASTKV